MAFDYRRFLKGYLDLCKQTGSHPEDGISAYAAANYVASKRKQAAWVEHREWWKNKPLWANPEPSEEISFPPSDDEHEVYYGGEYDSIHSDWWRVSNYWDNRGTLLITRRRRPTEDAALDSLWRQTRGKPEELTAETLEHAIEEWGAEVIVHILRTELRSLIQLDRAIGRPAAWVMIDRRGKQMPVKNPEWIAWQRKAEA